jgi:NADH-quinone oxidoreductase subunit J
MGEAIAFYVISAFILIFAVLVVTAKEAVHSVVFLVIDFLFVAALYALLGAEFVAIIQILVYAGGIVVLYLFVVMLVNLKRPPEAHSDPRRLSRLGVVMAAAVLAELAAIFAVGWVKPGSAEGTLSPQNVEQIGRALYTDYLIPFELASFLLLVAMIGAIILAKREL